MACTNGCDERPIESVQKETLHSQTMNQYTYLDAYHLPRIDDMVNDLAAYKVYSTFDLKIAYHQVPIQ